MTERAKRVAVVPGDGIGVEVTRAGVAVMQAAMRGDDSAGLEFEEFPWGCEYYLEHGRMMLEDALETLAGFNEIFFGAVGWPPSPTTSRSGASCSPFAATSISTSTCGRRGS